MKYQNVSLIGAGGTGSIIAPHLVKHLRKTYNSAFHLTIVDGDTISEKNLIRQGFTPDQVGQNKAFVLARQLDPSSVYVSSYENYFTPLHADEIMFEDDIVLIAADNYRARADIEQRAFELNNITIINGGNEATTASIQVFMRHDGENITPPLSYQHPEILTPGITREEESCLVRAESPDSDQTIAANLMSAAWMLGVMHHLAEYNNNMNELIEKLQDLRGNSQKIKAARAKVNDSLYQLRMAGPRYHEIYADLNQGRAGGPDWRAMGTNDWKTYRPSSQI